MSVTLAPLPYAEDALEPIISAETIRYHYGKHHQGYVNKLNALIEGSEFDEMTLPEIVAQSDELSSTTPHRHGTTNFTGTA